MADKTPAQELIEFLESHRAQQGQWEDDAHSEAPYVIPSREGGPFPQDVGGEKLTRYINREIESIKKKRASNSE